MGRWFYSGCGKSLTNCQTSVAHSGVFALYNKVIITSYGLRIIVVLYKMVQTNSPLRFSNYVFLGRLYVSDLPLFSGMLSTKGLTASRPSRTSWSWSSTPKRPTSLMCGKNLTGLLHRMCSLKSAVACCKKHLLGILPSWNPGCYWHTLVCT